MFHERPPLIHLPLVLSLVCFHVLTNCPLATTDLLVLCFHILTNCFFRKPFIFINICVALCVFDFRLHPHSVRSAHSVVNPVVTPFPATHTKLPPASPFTATHPKNRGCPLTVVFNNHHRSWPLRRFSADSTRIGIPTERSDQGRFPRPRIGHFPQHVLSSSPSGGIHVR